MLKFDLFVNVYIYLLCMVKLICLFYAKISFIWKSLIIIIMIDILINLFNGKSTPYGLLNGEISLIWKCLIVIVTIFSISSGID